MDFLHNSLQLIEQYMLAYGYWAVFFGVMLENAGLPIPGETILLVGGYFASSRPDQFNLIRVMLTAATGAVTGLVCSRPAKLPSSAPRTLVLLCA